MYQLQCSDPDEHKSNLHVENRYTRDRKGGREEDQPPKMGKSVRIIPSWTVLPGLSSFPTLRNCCGVISMEAEKALRSRTMASDARSDDSSIAITAAWYTTSWWKWGTSSSRRQRAASVSSPLSRYSLISSTIWNGTPG